MKFTTRSDFPETLPTVITYFCWHCRTPGAKERGKKRIRFFCDACGRSSKRVLIYDSNVQQHFDERERLVHESCGIFIARPDGKLLLFQRTKFPYLLTIPAGHLEVGEAPEECAARETEEEVGMSFTKLTELFKGNIEGDSCLGGADIHHWNAYLHVVDADAVQVTLDEEGVYWDWYDADELTAQNTVQPVLYLLRQDTVQQGLARLTAS